jgi:hypothetical protein
LEGPSELRLLVLLLLSAVPLVSAWRLARRLHGNDTLAALADAVLLHYLVQYLAVGAAGLLGVLSIGSLIVIVAVLSLAIELLRRQLVQSDSRSGATGQLAAPCQDGTRTRGNELPRGTLSRSPATADARCYLRPFTLAALWTVALVIALLERGWITPPLANDPLIYHLPAAAKWLQTGSLTIYEPWFHNPTNAFSPLAGSMFLAWWMAPLGNDFVARYGQTPALALLLLCTARLARDLGARPTPAAMLALAAVLCRPVIGQTQLAKDDLFVAAFFMAAMSALIPAALRDRAGVARLGAALGLLLATKYTVAYALPILLLAIDAPRRAGRGFRSYLLVIGIVLALAGPWFARNLLLAGNPLFPMRVEAFGLTLLDGPLRMTAEPELLSLRGFLGCVVASYYGTTVPLAIVLPLVWLVALVRSGRAVLTDPLRRALLLGPLLAAALFALTSPYTEARFILPAVLSLVVCPALLARQQRPQTPAVVTSAAVLLASSASSFIPQTLANLAATTLASFVVLLIIAWIVRRGWPIERVRRGLVVSAVLIGCGLTYVYWDAYLNGYRVKIEQDAIWAAPGYYEDLGRAWLWVRRELPDDVTIAIANTPFAYPLMGFELERRVTYIPTRADIDSMLDLPRIDRSLRGDEVVPAITTLLRQRPDRETWLRRLEQANADYLFVSLDAFGDQAPPPEVSLAESQPERFHRVFGNSAVIIYRVVRP